MLSLEAESGIRAVLPAVQAQFIAVSTKGIFTLPNHSGSSTTQVSISREVAAGLQLDTTRFASNIHLRSVGFVPAPVGVPPSRAVVGAQQAETEVVARASLRSGVLKGAGAVAAAAVVYDVATSANETASLWKQGNHTGAASEVVHFDARNLGMWSGAVLGAEVFGTAGAESGPLDVVVGGAGALVGAIAGDKLADAMDRRRIYHQRGPDGSTWTYDQARPAQGWTCATSELDTDATRLNDGFPVYRQHSRTADAALADWLNYQASNTAVELALAHPPRPEDPYTQSAVTGDTHSIRDAPWTRDPQTHAWTRRVVHGLLEHGMVNAHVERAPAARATELDRAAEKTVARNAAQSPDAIASRYESAYREYGWEKHGPLPQIVATTLHLAQPSAATVAHARTGTTFPGAEPPVATPAPVPTHLTDFRQAGHPLHAFYERALAKVHDMEDRYQMPYGMHSERLAASLTDAVAAYNVGKRPQERFGTLERIDLQGQGTDRQAVAIDQQVNYHMPQVRVGLPVDKAVSRSVEQSSQDWAHRHMPHLRAESRAKAVDVGRPGNAAWPAYDPRHPDNARHLQFEMLRTKVAGAYAHAGIFRDPDQLDEAAAAVLLHTRHGHGDGSPAQLNLLADPRTGVIGLDSDLLVQQTHGALTLRTRIPSTELHAAPDQTFMQMIQAGSHGLPEQPHRQTQAR